MGPLPDMRWQLASPVDPPCGKSAIRLMKDQFIDDLARASKLDSEAFQLDDAKSSVVMRCKTVSRLVVGLQYKLPFCTQRHAMRRRATPENADAPRTESHVDAVTSGKAREDNVSDHGLKRCRKTDDVALAVGQEGNREPVRQQTVEVLWQFEGLIVTMRHGGDHPAPRPVQGSILLLYRHDAVGRMFIVAGIGRKIVRRAGIWVAGLFPRLLVNLHLDKGLFPLLAEALAPIDRLAAAQAIDDVPGQRSQNCARVAIGQDRDPHAKVRHEGHPCSPTRPTSTMKKHPVTAIALTLKTKAIMRCAELGEF